MRVNRWLIFFGLLTILFGTAWGAFLGKAEDAIQDKARAQIVANAAVHGLASPDDPKVEKLMSKFWARAKRIHLHAEGIGTLLIATGFVAGLLTLPAGAQNALGLVMGLGGFIYPLGWVLATHNLPTRGAGAAEKLGEWLFVPGGMSVLLGTAALLGLFAWQHLLQRRNPG